MNLYDILKQRGFVEQATDENDLRKLLDKQKITFYIGFDPTAESLHIGNLLTLMAMAWAQKLGHQPIALAGGGTGLVGDPSGKDTARPIMTLKQVDQNVQGIKKQFSKIIDFDKNRALLLNNADWLTKLNYIEFLRDFGALFSVNRMLTHEAIKSRLSKGMSFLEFNYQLLQAYDFWYQFKHYNCVAQFGGSDQWGNIVAGVELIRRLEKKQAYGLTFPLLKTASGKKMGKSETGAVWLDAKKTSPYEYYQFWINTDDADVVKFLYLFTFLPLEEIKKYAKLKGEEIKKAKEVLAYEATKIIHGENEAEKARDASLSLFGGGQKQTNSVPTTFIDKKELHKGISQAKFLYATGVTNSISVGRRLITQGGVYFDEERLNDPDAIIYEFKNNEVLIRIGKKKYKRIKLK